MAVNDSFLNADQPPAFPDPKDMTKRKDWEDWFRGNIQFIAKQWDQAVTLRGQTIPDGESVLRPSEKMDKMFLYALGKQDIGKWKHTITAANNAPLRLVHIPGQDVSAMVKHLRGVHKTMVKNFKITVKLNSKDAMNKRTEMLEGLRTKFALAADYKEFEAMGVSYNPVGSKEKDFLNVQEAERWVNMDYQEEAAVWGGKIANDIYWRNHLAEKADQAMTSVWCVGLTGMHNYVYNNRVITDWIESQNLIWDSTKGFDQFNREGQYAGFIEWITPSYTLQRWHKQLKDDEIEEIKKTTPENEASLAIFPKYGNVAGYTRQGSGIKYSKVTVYWKAKRNLGWKNGTVKEDGFKSIFKTKDGKGDYYDQCVYQGTLIAGKYLVDIGVAPNQVKDPYNPGESELPIKVFAPNIMLGETNSIVSQLHQLQDLVDYYTNAIKLQISKAVGKGIVVYADMLDGTVAPAAFISDLEQFNVTFLNRKKGNDEAVDSRTRDKIMDTVDMTLDPNIKILADLRREQTAIMEAIVSLSPISRGTQTQYVSQGAQQTAIGQSNISMTGTLEAFAQYMEIVMQNATNMGKIIYSMEDGNEIPIVGKRGADFLKETVKYSNEELGVYIQVNDIITEQGRLRLQAQAQAAMAAGLITMKDWVFIEKCQTYTEILDYYEVIGKRQELSQQQQQQLELEKQQIEADRQDAANDKSNETKVLVTDKNNATKKELKELDVAADMVKFGGEMQQQQQAMPV